MQSTLLLPVLTPCSLELPHTARPLNPSPGPMISQFSGGHTLPPDSRASPPEAATPIPAQPVPQAGPAHFVQTERPDGA